MRHLTIEQLIDLAEGAETESSVLHLRTCGECRRQLTELRGVMSAVADLEVPEPSPLFWDHFAARVHHAVTAVEPDSVGSTLVGRGRAVGARLAAALSMRVAAVGGLAVLVVAVGLFFVTDRPAPVFAPPDAGSGVVEVTAAVAPLADDPSLSLVADLAADLDWEAAREAGLTTHVGIDDDALNELTSAERGELGRLLQGELAPSRRGA